MKHTRVSASTFEPRDGYARSIIFTANDFNTNTKLQLMRLGPGQRIKPHHHNIRTECFKLVSGTGKIYVNGQVVASSEDDVVLCEPGDIHEFINTSQTEPLTFLVIRTNDTGDEDMIWEPQG